MIDWYSFGMGMYTASMLSMVLNPVIRLAMDHFKAQRKERMNKPRLRCTKCGRWSVDWGVTPSQGDAMVVVCLDFEACRDACLRKAT